MSPPNALRWLREPVLHFLVVGAVLFAIDALRTDATPGRDDTRIVVDAEVRSSLAERWHTTLGAAPSPEELARELETWKDQEVLYREGLRRGLDRGDPTVRERVARKMGQALAATVVVPQPTDEELRAWYAANATRWQKSELVDFTHVFVAGGGEESRARAVGLQEQLTAGAEPARLGDTFQGGRRYRGRKLDDLAASFGDTFASALREASEADGSWGVVGSRFGWHVVRIDRRSAAAAPAFEEVRADVQKDWQDTRRDALRAEAMAGMRAGWTFVELP